jgi:hypothetical protein
MIKQLGLVLLLAVSLQAHADDAPSFADIKAKHEAFAEFNKGLEGSAVQWNGTVLESNSRVLGGQYLIIDMDGDNKEDLHLLFGKDRETEIKAYKHGDKVAFESKLPFVSPYADGDLLIKIDNPTLKKTADGKTEEAKVEPPKEEPPKAETKKPVTVKATDDLIVDVPKISGESKQSIETLLGKPDECEPSKYGEKCRYIKSHTEIVYISGRADWITVGFKGVPYEPSSITKLGFEKEIPTFVNDFTTRWEGIGGLLEVSLFPGEGGQVSYAHIKSFTE